MLKKILMVIYIIGFMGIIIAPFVFADKQGGQISESENRYLSSWPTATIGTAKYKEQLEAWLNDNLALRNKLTDLSALVKYNGFHIVDSNDVEKGKDGWLFYTELNNLEIATGNYVIEEETLQEIANIQQKIHDYYQSMGKTYVLLLVPTKVSVYPEYLYGDYSVTRTPNDIIYDYLTEHTDVIVVNAKDDLLAAKDEGQLFWKTDTHLTSLGYYQIYQSLINTLNNNGLTDIKRIDVDYDTQTNNTNLLDMLGLPIFLKEEADDIVFDSSAVLMQEGEYFGVHGPVDLRECFIEELYVYNNKQVTEDLNLLVYGTSHMELFREFSLLLAEHFKETTLVLQNYPTSVYDIDSASDADIVLYTVGERKLLTDYMLLLGDMDILELDTESEE